MHVLTESAAATLPGEDRLVVGRSDFRNEAFSAKETARLHRYGWTQIGSSFGHRQSGVEE